MLLRVDASHFTKLDDIKLYLDYIKDNLKIHY